MKARITNINMTIIPFSKVHALVFLIHIKKLYIKKEIISISTIELIMVNKENEVKILK